MHSPPPAAAPRHYRPAAGRLAGALLALAAAGAAHAQPEIRAQRDRMVSLQPFATITAPGVFESSGLAASRKHPGLVWTHNDSGDGPRLHPITVDGRPWPGAQPGGLEVAGARAVDWEDITFDDRGQLVIGDLGNNANDRRDLTVYFLPEPLPTAVSATAHTAVRVHYPEQTAFPPTQLNFDCEAIFWADGRLHLLTKNRSNTAASLYRLDTQLPFPQSNPLSFLRELPVGAQVTAADVSPDGLTLAVLGYGVITLYSRAEPKGSFFAAAPRMSRFFAWQSEGLTFLHDTGEILVSNEQRSLYRIQPAWIGFRATRTR